MFIIFSYLLFHLRDIYLFLKGYVLTNNFTYVENMVGNYLNAYMFILVIFLIISSVVIYLLMRQKDKPVLFYIVLFVYSLVLLIVLIIDYQFFVSLEYKVYDRVTLTIYRDINGVLYYMDYFYIVFAFIRGFGFDIKKFSFDKDLKKLNIDVKDNEEYELSLEVDTDNITNSLRKEKRMFGYYIKENALALTIILGVLLIAVGSYLYINYGLINKTYSLRDKIIADDFTYVINDIYFQKKDKYGENINDKYFAIVNFSVKNNKTKKVIDIDKFRILVDNVYYYPIYSRYSSFDDLGNGYNKQTINGLAKYIIVFEISSKVENKDILLEIYNNYQEKNNIMEINYKKVKLNFARINTYNVGNYAFKEEVSLEKSHLQDSKLTINSYEIGNIFNYQYEKCLNEVCNKYDKVVVPSINKKVLKISYILNSDDITADNFFDSYLFLQYTDGGVTKEIAAKDIAVLGVTDDNIYLDVTNSSFQNMKFVFKIREATYTFLEEGNAS